MTMLTHEAIDHALEEGKVPFVECPGDGLVPAEVRNLATVICPVCGGTQNVYDLHWMTPAEAKNRGWNVLLTAALPARGPVH